MRKRWIKRFAVVALATAVSVYTVPKTGLLAAMGLSQTTEAEEASSDQKGPGGTSSGVSDYSAVNKLTSDAVLDGQTITSTGTDENAVNVSEGANVTVKNSTVSRESSDSTGGDNSSFYGVGSALLCTNGVLNVVKDTIRLYDCDLTGNMKDDSQNDCTWNVILYQSMSGDSQVGNSTFEMQGGSLTAKNGGMFYTTNTESTFTLKDVDITNADDGEFFLKCTGNSNQRGWGNSGSNGADCLFTAISQKMNGDINRNFCNSGTIRYDSRNV